MTLNDNEQLIRTQLLNAEAIGDTEGILRALKDLESLGWNDVRICSRVIGIHGERIEVKHYLDGRIRIMGGSRAFKIIWILRFKGMAERKDFYYLKHENDMSPEEWEWVFK